MSTALDRRAEAAAAAVRAAVTHLEPAAGELPEAPRRRWPALAAAVALVAAAVAGALLLERDAGRDVVAGPSGSLPRLVVDDLPEDLTEAGAVDLPAPGSLDATFRLYGRGDGEDPLRDGDVGILVSRSAGSFSVSEGRQVQVRGVEGTSGQDPTYGWSLAWEEPDVGSVLLHSRSMSGSELLQLAEGLRREGDDLLLDPPAGYGLVADQPGLPGLVPAFVGSGDEVSAVEYGSRDGERSLTVAVAVDRPGALDALRWLGGRSTRAVEIRGHDGWFVPPSTDSAVPLSIIGWREQQGVLVTVGGFGLTEDELRTAAESLRPATDEEWEELQASAAEEVLAQSEDMPALAGTSTWRYSRDGDEGVCFEVLDEGGASGTCYSDEPRLSEGAEQADQGWWFHGRVADEVVRVALRQGAAAPQLVDTVPMEGGGRAWAALLPNGGATKITALDAAGGAVEEVTFDTETRAEGAEATTGTTA